MAYTKTIELSDMIDEALGIWITESKDLAWVAQALAKLAWLKTNDSYTSTEADANLIALAQVFATLALNEKGTN